MLFFVCCFFFKQKTAYELRISDWSSDVCASDQIELDEMGAGRRSVCRCGKCLGDIGAGQRRGHDEDALHEVGSLTDRAYLRFDLGLSSAAGQARYCRGRALVAIGSCP